MTKINQTINTRGRNRDQPCLSMVVTSNGFDRMNSCTNPTNPRICLGGYTATPTTVNKRTEETRQKDHPTTTYQRLINTSYFFLSCCPIEHVMIVLPQQFIIQIKLLLCKGGQIPDRVNTRYISTRTGMNTTKYLSAKAPSRMSFSFHPLCLL